MFGASNVSKPPSEALAPPLVDARMKGYALMTARCCVVTLILQKVSSAMNDDTDFTIVLDDRRYSWRTHADLLAKEASFFKTMFEGPWKVSGCLMPGLYHAAFLADPV